MEDVFLVVLYIAASLALLALAWLFVSVAKTVKGLGAVLENTNKVAAGLVGEVTGLRTSLQGTINNVELITSRVPQTLDHVNGQLAQVDGILGSVRDLTDDLTGEVARLTGDATDLVHAAKGVAISLIDFEQEIQLKVQRPVSELMTIFSALGKGIQAFRLKVSGNGNGRVLNGSPATTIEDFDDEYDDFDYNGGETPVIERERAPAYRM